MKKLLVFILFVLFGTHVSAQNFNKGLKAAHAGDDATALKEWKPLAEQGEASAQYNLGVMYQKGRGVLKDYAEAVKWYRLAAEQGEAFAQLNLGTMYEGGSGVPKDYAEAVKWYRLSAEQGRPYAQHNLGLMYQKGYGVLKDNVTAHMWFNISSANGHEISGEHRDERAGLMTSNAIEKATAMARECMASDYKKCGF